MQAAVGPLLPRSLSRTSAVADLCCVPRRSLRQSGSAHATSAALPTLASRPRGPDASAGFGLVGRGCAPPGIAREAEGGGAQRSRSTHRQRLARVAAPLFYALRQSRLPRLPLRARAAERPGTLPAAAQVVRRRPVRLRDALRAAAHRSQLSARGLRCRAPPWVPGTYFHAGEGEGWVPGRRGRRGREDGVAGQHGLRGFGTHRFHQWLLHDVLDKFVLLRPGASEPLSPGAGPFIPANW